MHWFWRATIAVVGGCVSEYIYYVTIIAVLNKFGCKPSQFLNVVVLLSMIVVPQIVGIPIYAVLTRRYGPMPFDGETRCRKCQYILKGISEPRCPECGERI